MRRNHAGSTEVTFGLAAPASFAADAESLPECVIVSWKSDDRNVTTRRIYRSTEPDVAATPANLLKVVPHTLDHFRDYEVDFGKRYYYRIAADSFGNESELSPEIAAVPRKAPPEPRWYLGDGHFHTYTHDVDVEDFTPEDSLFEAKKLGWDFVLVTEHNSLGAYYRAEDQGTDRFVVFGNGQEISDGGKHRTGAFLTHFVPTSGRPIEVQNAEALAMGGEVGPNHDPYRDGPPNITLFELVNDRKWFPFDAWDDYLRRGVRVVAKGGSDGHGRFSVKRGYRWCVWSDRLSYRALKEAIRAGRTVAVDGDGLLCMLKVNGAMIGDTLTLEPGTPLKLEIEATSERGDIDEVKLVKFGSVHERWTPGGREWRTTLENGTFDGTPTYYRLEVTTAGAEKESRRAVSSAIFVRPAQAQ